MLIHICAYALCEGETHSFHQELKELCWPKEVKINF